MSTFSIVLLVLAAAVLWIIAMYNQLVRKRNLVREGWSGIDVQLKRRANLIPNLVETVKGYARHEAETLAKVTQMRNPGGASMAERRENEQAIGAALRQLFAVAESYPDLKASQNFLDLQNNLDEIETEIQHARRYYNGAARDLNIMIESFPSNFVAGSFGFTPAEFFEIEETARGEVPAVKF